MVQYIFKKKSPVDLSWTTVYTTLNNKYISIA